MGYILAADSGSGQRLLWLVVFFVSLGLAICLTQQAYVNWQENQVITTLKDIAKPISQLSFPAITVCGSGLNMNLVLEVITTLVTNRRPSSPFKAFGTNFRKWKKEEILEDPEHNRTYEEWLEIYLEEKYQIKSQSENFFDILDTMLAPNENSLATSLGFVLNLITNIYSAVYFPY